MKCLSLYQPWASLVVSGRKSVETRGWRIHYRGPLLIHAGKAWTGQLAEICLTHPFRSALAAFGVPGTPHFFTANDMVRKKAGWDMPRGAIVGLVNVVDCFPTEDTDEHAGPGFHIRRPCGSGSPVLSLTRTERQFGDYTPGRFGFLLADPVRFPSPIPYRGAQGLFDVPTDVIPEAYRPVAPAAPAVAPARSA